MSDQATMRPTLFIFAGLPGAGKSTLAKRLANTLKAAYLRIDTIEQGLRDICSIRVECVNIEVLCSDVAEHRKRVESRASEVPGLALPSWTDVQGRDYEPWTVERVRVDTAGESEHASFDTLVAAIQRRPA